MANRGPQSFQKRQKEQQRREKQAEKMQKRLQKKHLKPGEPEDELMVLDGPVELDENGEPILPGEPENPQP